MFSGPVALRPKIPACDFPSIQPGSKRVVVQGKLLGSNVPGRFGISSTKLYNIGTYITTYTILGGSLLFF